VKLRYFHKLALSSALAFILLLTAASPTSMPVLSISKPRITEEHIADYKQNPNKRFDTNLIVDSQGQQSSEFRALASRVIHVSGSLYRGFLNSDDVDSLANLEGITFERNRPADTMPVNQTKPNWSVPKFLWGTEGTVNQQNPDLRFAREQTGISGQNVLVAVLDTGVDSEALGLGQGKVVHREDFSTPPEDGKCSDKGKLDPYGHGTHVASIIAGNSARLEGVAPAASIVDLRVLNCDGSGYMSDVDEALQWILDNRNLYPIKVVNMSIGTNDGQRDGLDSTSILINRLTANGVFVSVSAGNGGASGSKLYAPATAEFAVTVAAATKSKYGNFLAPYSSHGPTSDNRAGIDVTAPGSGVIAALSSARPGFPVINEVIHSGTSMAAPYVSGLAALLLEQHPELAPSGEVCELSDQCPEGVAKESMTNGILGLFKTTDWYSPGLDPDSGTGLVSASASLLGEQLVSAKTIRTSTDGLSDTVLQFDPSDRPHVVSFWLDNSWVSNMWDHSERFEISMVNQNQQQGDMTLVCSMLAEGSCQGGESTFAPRLYNYYLAPSDSPTYFVIKTNKVVQMTVSVDSYSGDIKQLSGISISSVDLSEIGEGYLRVSRTQESNEETFLQLSASGGVEIQTSVVLPSGPAGTVIQVPIQRPTVIEHSLEKVVATNSDGLFVVGEIRVSQSPYGRVIFPNSLTYDDWQGNGSPYPQDFFIADDGTILSMSAGTGMRNSSGYGNPYLVPPGSMRAEPIVIPQASSSEIDSLGLSADGSTALFRAFPASSGIVPDDDDLSFTYFVRNLESGINYQVGPAQNLWSAWNLAPTPKFLIEGDGSAVAWLVKMPDGTSKLAVDYGENFSQTLTIATFNDTVPALEMFSMTNGKILVKVIFEGKNQFRLYDLAGNFTVINSPDQNPRVGIASPSGTAVAFLGGAENQAYCWTNGHSSQIELKEPLGMLESDIRVADDCSWIILYRYVTVRGDTTFYLEKLFANGSHQTLAKSTDSSTWRQWRLSSNSQQFMTISQQAFEPGDMNFTTDLYRGLHSSPQRSFSRRLPLIEAVDMNAWSLRSERNLPHVETDSTGTVEFRVISGACEITAGKLVPLSQTGVCQVELSIAEDESFFTNSIRFTIYLGEHRWSSKWIPQLILDSVSELQFLGVFQPVYYSLVNYTLSTSGPCHLLQSNLVQADSGVGTCVVTIVTEQNDMIESTTLTKSVSLLRRSLPGGRETIDFPESLRAGIPIDLNIKTFVHSQIRVAVDGPCRIEGSKLIGLSRGDCLVYVDIAQNDYQNEFHGQAVVQIIGKSLARLSLNSGSFTFRHYPELDLVAQTNSDGNLSFSLVDGPCRLDGKLLTSSSKAATCSVKVSVSETEGFLGTELIGVFNLEGLGFRVFYRNIGVWHRAALLNGIYSWAE